MGEETSVDEGTSVDEETPIDEETSVLRGGTTSDYGTARGGKAALALAPPLRGEPGL